MTEKVVKQKWNQTALLIQAYGGSRQGWSESFLQQYLEENSEIEQESWLLSYQLCIDELKLYDALNIKKKQTMQAVSGWNNKTLTVRKHLQYQDNLRASLTEV